MTRIRIWDLPTRLFHWSLACCVVALVVTGNIGGNAMVWHFRLGQGVLALLAFRFVWGLIGGRWSRFSAFLYSPVRVWAYWRGNGQALDEVGHNPLGALSVCAMLLILTLQVASGLSSDDEIAFAGPLTRYLNADTVGVLTQYHKEVGKLLLLALVVAHVLAILYYRIARKKVLVLSMITGDKVLPNNVPASTDGNAQRWLAAVVFGVCVSVSFWVMSLGV